jgi:STE24 endopeptidase
MRHFGPSRNGPYARLSRGPNASRLVQHLPLACAAARLMRAVIALFCLLALLISPATRPCAAQNEPAALRAGQAGKSRPDPYTPHLPERAVAYHRFGRALLFAGIGWRVLGLALLLRMGVSATWRDWADRLVRRLSSGRELAPAPASGGAAPSFIAVATYYVLFTATMSLWMLPIGLADLALERRFGFSNESLLLFMKDHGVALCITWVMIPIVWLGYQVYVRWPRTWWLILWAAIAPVSLFVTVVYPLVISPLYNRYTPLPPGRLRDEIVALARKASIPNAQVFVEDTSVRTSHVNAYVIGIGPSTRVVINDTALQQLPEDQILAMVGHELGHYAEHHVLIGAAAGTIGTGAILGLLAVLLPILARRFGPKAGLTGPGDLAALPLIFLTIALLNLLAEPVATALSRTLEHRADAYGLRITGLNDATAKLMVGFAERDLTDPDPPRWFQLWFGTHPSLSERIEFARRYRRGPTP